MRTDSGVRMRPKIRAIIRFVPHFFAHLTPPRELLIRTAANKGKEGMQPDNVLPVHESLIYPP